MIDRVAVVNQLHRTFNNEDFTNRDIRHIVLAGPPQPPGANTYNCRFWNFYINRFLFPQLFEDEDLNTFLGVNHAELYRLVKHSRGRSWQQVVQVRKEPQ